MNAPASAGAKRSRKVPIRADEKKHDPFAAANFTDIGVRHVDLGEQAERGWLGDALGIQGSGRRPSASPRGRRSSRAARMSTAGFPGPRQSVGSVGSRHGSAPAVADAVMVQSLKKEVALHQQLLSKKTDEVAMVRQREHMVRMKYQQKVDELQEEILRLVAGENPHIDHAAKAREGVLQRCLDMTNAELKETQGKLAESQEEVEKLQHHRDLLKQTFAKLKQFVHTVGEIKYVLGNINVAELFESLQGFMCASIVRILRLIPPPPVASAHVYPLLLHGYTLRTLVQSFTGVLLAEPNLLEEAPEELHEVLPGIDEHLDPAEGATHAFYTSKRPPKADGDAGAREITDPAQVKVPEEVACGHREWQPARVTKYVEDMGYGVGGLEPMIPRLRALEKWVEDERQRKLDALRKRLANSKEVQTEEDIYKKLYEETLAKLKECEAEKERIEAELKELQEAYAVLETELEEQKELNAKAAAEIEDLKAQNEELETHLATAAEENQQLHMHVETLTAQLADAEQRAAEAASRAAAAAERTAAAAAAVAEAGPVHAGPAALNQILTKTMGSPMTESLVKDLRNALPGMDLDDEDVDIWDVVRKCLDKIADQGFAPEHKSNAKVGEGMPDFPDHIKERMVFCHRCASGPYGQPEKYCVYCNAFLYYGLVGTIPLGKVSEGYWQTHVGSFLQKKKAAMLMKKKKKELEDAAAATGEEAPDGVDDALLHVPRPIAPPAMSTMEDLRKQREEAAAARDIERQGSPTSPTCVSPVPDVMHPTARLVSPAGKNGPGGVPYIPTLPRGMYGAPPPTAADCGHHPAHRTAIVEYVRPAVRGPLPDLLDARYAPQIDPYNPRPQPLSISGSTPPLRQFFIGSLEPDDREAPGDRGAPAARPGAMHIIGGAYAHRARSAGGGRCFASTLGHPGVPNPNPYVRGLGGARGGASLKQGEGGEGEPVQAHAATQPLPESSIDGVLNVHEIPLHGGGVAAREQARCQPQSRERVFLHMVEPQEMDLALQGAEGQPRDAVELAHKWLPRHDQYAQGYRKAQLLMHAERAHERDGEHSPPLITSPPRSPAAYSMALAHTTHAPRPPADGVSPREVVLPPQGVMYGRAPLMGAATKAVLTAPHPPPPRGVKGKPAPLWKVDPNGGAPMFAGAGKAGAEGDEGGEEAAPEEGQAGQVDPEGAPAGGAVAAAGPTYVTAVRVGGAEPPPAPNVAYAPMRLLDATGWTDGKAHSSWTPGADCPIAASSGFYISEPHTGHVSVAAPQNRPSPSRPTSSRVRQNLMSVPDLKPADMRVGAVPAQWGNAMPHEWQRYASAPGR